MSAAIWMLAASMAASDAPAPAGARPGALDQELVINSVPTRVREWSLDMGMDEALSFYRQLLGARHIELRNASGPLLAAPYGGRFMTVELLQVDPARTRARVSEAQIGAPVPGDDSIPMPVDARILSNITGGNGAQRSRTLVARTAANLASTAQFYRQVFARRGLHLVERRSIQQGSSPAQLLSFAGANERIELVLTADVAATWISAVSLAGGP